MASWWGRRGSLLVLGAQQARVAPGTEPPELSLKDPVGNAPVGQTRSLRRDNVRHRQLLLLVSLVKLQRFLPSSVGKAALAHGLQLLRRSYVRRGNSASPLVRSRTFLRWFLFNLRVFIKE